MVKKNSSIEFNTISGCFILGTLGACGFLVAIGYMGCNSTWAVVCCIISVGFLGFHTSGPIISHLDVASNYSGRNKSHIHTHISDLFYRIGTLVGITNSLATIPGFVGPAIVGAITNNNVRLIDFEIQIEFLFLLRHSKLYKLGV